VTESHYEVQIVAWIFPDGRALVDWVRSAGAKRVTDDRHFGRDGVGRRFAGVTCGLAAFAKA